MALLSDPALRRAKRAVLSLEVGHRIRAVSDSTLRSWQRRCREHSKESFTGETGGRSALGEQSAA